jgi:tRNA G18 (ribose-2'-O)-methylase SpoU
VPLFVLPTADIERLVGFNFHRGALACGRRPPEPTIDQLTSRLGPLARLVVCPETHDPQNLGSILRSAAALGIDAVVLGQRSADPFSRRVLRVSMGSVFKQTILTSNDLQRDLTVLRGPGGVELVAAVIDSTAESLERFAWAPRSALLLGNEAHGLEPGLVALCERRVTIGMHGGTDSLNVAQAAAILLYEMTRARR